MNTALILFGLNLAPLYDAIAKVESDRGATSANVYQIRRIYHADFQRIMKFDKSNELSRYDDVIASPTLSEVVMFHYWRHYGAQYLAANPCRRMTYEWMARVHNGGPTGYLKQSTIRYWNRVRKAIEEAE